MVKRFGNARAFAREMEAILEADDGLMRLYRSVWYGTLALFGLWLACVAF